MGTAFVEPYNNAALPLAGAWDPLTNNIYGGIGQYFVTKNLKFIGAGAIILEDTRERGVYLAAETPAASITSDLLTPFFGATRR